MSCTNISLLKLGIPSINKEGFTQTLANAYFLTFISRITDILFFVGIFSFLSNDQVGLYSWTIAVAAFCAVGLDLGITQVLLREFSAGSLSFRPAAWGAFFIRLPMLLLGTLIYYFWQKEWNPPADEYIAITLASLIQVFLIGENFLKSWLKAKSNQTLANLLSLGESIGKLVTLGLIITWLGNITAINVLGGTLLVVISFFIITTLVVVKIRKLLPKTNYEVIGQYQSSIRTLLGPGIIFGLVGLINVIQNRLDWLMVSHFTNNAGLADYAMANRAYEILMVFFGVTLLTIYPWICKKDLSKIRKLKIDITMMFLVAFGCILAFSGALYFPLLIEWFWEDKYRNAKPLLQALMPMIAISCLIMCFYYQLIARGLEKYVLKASILATTAQLIVNAVLIPSIGSIGAVAGMATLALVNFCCYSAIAFKKNLPYSNQVWPSMKLFFLMSSTTFLLWTNDVTPLMGIFTLVILGMIFGYLLMMTDREKWWLKAFSRRATRLAFRGQPGLTT